MYQNRSDKKHYQNNKKGPASKWLSIKLDDLTVDGKEYDKESVLEGLLAVLENNAVPSIISIPLTVAKAEVFQNDTPGKINVARIRKFDVERGTVAISFFTNNDAKKAFAQRVIKESDNYVVVPKVYADNEGTANYIAEFVLVRV